MDKDKAVVKADVPVSVKFMNKVVSEFSSGVSEIALTNFQKRLAQNYFIALDSSLKMAEEKRLKKSEKYRDALPVTWANVDMTELAQSVIAAARIGWDPSQDNHVSLIPFKKNALNKYGITFMPGYRGIELKAKKYGLDIPDHVVVELVCFNDKFKSFKKDRNNKFETYEFEIVNDFDRGTIVGGFYYHVYVDNPEKNKLVVFTVKDIEKRKPSYAAPEFWGGEKDVWKNGQKVGKEHTDGWYEKMCYKTVYRAAYKDITIDSQKIDDDYMRLKQTEQSFAEATQEIAEKANREIIDITADAMVTDESTDGSDQHEEQPPATESQSEPDPREILLAPTGTDGPDF
jgi:recombination protein RecT